MKTAISTEVKPMAGENPVHGAGSVSSLLSAPFSPFPLDVSSHLGPEPHESLPPLQTFPNGRAKVAIQCLPESIVEANESEDSEIEMLISETAEQLHDNKDAEGGNLLVHGFDDSRLRPSFARLISEQDAGGIYRHEEIADFRSRHYESAGKTVAALRETIEGEDSLTQPLKDQLTKLQEEFQTLAKNFLRREASASGGDNNNLQTLRTLVGGREGIERGWVRCLFSKNARRARTIQRRAEAGESFDSIYTGNKLRKIHPKAALALYLRGRLKSIGLGGRADTSTALLAKGMAKEYRSLTERSKAWSTYSHIHRNFSIKVPRGGNNAGFDEKPLHMESKQTPASELQSLRTSFQNGVRGVSCLNSRDKSHATNLWKTEYLPVEGSSAKVSFAGFRHGVLDAYGFKNNAAERKAAGIEKASELVRAAAAEMRDAVTKTSDGQWTIPMVSVSLQTAGWKGDGEMIESQDAAWNALQEQGVQMEGPAPDGSNGAWTLKPNCNRFFIGVNPLALGGGYKSAVKNSRIGHWEGQFGKQNDASLTRLMGQARAARTQVLNDLPLNDDKFLKAQLILELIDQISSMQLDRSYQKLDDDPYKLATRVLLLAHLIGTVPSFNCKSGKDRTGVVDVETKALIQSINENIALHGITSNKNLVPAYGRSRSDNQKSTFQDLHLHGGGLQVSFANTGLMGNKTNIGNYLHENLDAHTVEMIAGFAKHADGNK